MSDTPSVIGGFPTSADLVPNIIISVAFGLSLIPFVYRLFKPESRVILPILHTVLFSFEHCIVYAVRTTSSHGSAADAGAKADSNLLYYYQFMVAVGYAQLAIDLVSLFKELLVNTTLADEGRGSFDQPQQRAKYRRIGRIYNLQWLLVLILGGIAASMHGLGTNTTEVIVLRYMSGVLGFGILIFFFGHLMRARSVKHIDTGALNILCVLTLVLVVSPLYRLTVMYNRTPYIPGTTTPDTSAAGSLTSTKSKIIFYLFHVVPELIVTIFLQSISIRKIFNTSAMGDYRWTDKKGIPRLRYRGQIVDGVGVDSKLAPKIVVDDGSRVELLRPNPQGWRQSPSMDLERTESV